ncbi:MAG: erythromycin esterase family protein, partial [Saprospiraceae bacterium]|nr:erythromycin esterase family protein [Saprospiraceae bacterium]
MKHKIFRKLVLEKGFKAIVFEIPWGNALVVNDYVLNDVGAANEVINQTWYWTYDTEEVRELVKWMHDYNLDKSAEDKIHFVGCDPQGPDFSIEEKLVREYVLSIFPDSTFFISSAYQNLPNNNLSSYVNDDPFIHNSNIIGIQTVLQLFENHKDILITTSSLFEYEVAKMAAHLIKERERIYRTAQFGAPRDSLMAFYALWWSRILGEDSQLATWAHNLHVMDGGSFNSALMGTVLKDELDDDYINVGFSFSKGSLNAFLADRNRNAIGGTRRQSLSAPVCNSTNHLLYEVDG